MNNFIENIFYGLYAEAEDSKETTFYRDKFFEDIELYADPKYDKNSTSNHFYDIVAPLSRSSQIQDFKQGVAFAMKLAAECFAVPERTHDEVEMEYERLVRPVMEGATK